MFNRPNKDIIEECECPDCTSQDTPCFCDCDQDADECEGCYQAREAAKDAEFDAAHAQGLL